MSFAHLQASDYVPVLERVVQALGLMVSDNEHVDIIQFAEDKEYLGLTLYPRQRLILKLYYKLPLTDDELADVKDLLRADNKYAKLYFPNLCRHHITGECGRKHCQLFKHDYRLLTDAEIRERLLNHHAHILEVIAGRRGSKSVLGAIVNCYELYRLLRSPNPQRAWGLIPGQLIGTANVATDETQALGLFNQLKALMDNSPWFQRLKYRSLETLIDFSGRGLFSRSFHSNSASVRGNTLIAINIDEFCHMNRTTGKMSDRAMWDAIRPSILTFKDEARVVITSSPLNKAGTAWELFAKAEEGQAQHIIAFQLATWEMNNTITRDDPDIASSYMFDADAAEMEYGGQWAEQVGQYIPPEAVDNCGKRERQMQRHGTSGIRYSLHIDLAKKRDRCGLAVCHYDKELGIVVVDRMEEIDPTKGDSSVVNDFHEIDHEALFQYIVDLHQIYKFRFNSITFDQFNSAWLVQALRKHFGDVDGKWINEITITDKSNREMFGSLRSLIVQGGIEYYRHTELMKQLTLLARTIKPSGAWKVEAPPGFHDDMADALAAAAWMCLQLALERRSGIAVVGKTAEDDLAPASVGTLKHDKGCKPGHYCVWNCPVSLAKKQSPLPA